MRVCRAVEPRMSAGSDSSDAATTTAAPVSASSSSSAMAAPPPSSADRAAFFSASNAARAARKREKHERAQAALTEAHQSKLAEEKLEALEWCRKNLQISEPAQAARSGGGCRLQRCIVLLQFSGTGYKGMQLQNRQNKDSTKSIEGALLHALYRSGAIDDSMQCVQDMRWQRTARTDAGVHAAFNVFSCILLYDDGLLERLRSQLPADIGVLSIMSIADFESAESAAALSRARSSSSAASSAAPTSAASSSACADASASSICVAIAAPPVRSHPFHAKDSCTGRLYEYILPTAMWGEDALVSPAAVTMDSSAPAASSSPAAASPSSISSAAGQSPSDGASSSAAFSPGASAAAAAAAAAAPAPASSSNPAAPSRLPYNPSALLSSHASFDFESFAAARLDVAAALPKINVLLSRFVGTKSFHNFGTPAATGPKRATNGATSGTAASSPPSSAASSRSGSPNRSPSSAAAAAATSSPSRRASRNPAQKTVFSFALCPDTFERDGVQYCRLLIEGRSFILHQIRKMVGLAVLVQRGVVHESIFETVFDLGSSYDVPAIPARGLLLLRPAFAKYDAACDLTSQSACSISRAFTAMQPSIEHFKRNVIEKEICKARVAHAAYRAWIKSVEQEAKAKTTRG